MDNKRTIHWPTYGGHFEQKEWEATVDLAELPDAFAAVSTSTEEGPDGTYDLHVFLKDMPNLQELTGREVWLVHFGAIAAHRLICAYEAQRWARGLSPSDDEEEESPEVCRDSYMDALAGQAARAEVSARG